MRKFFIAAMLLCMHNAISQDIIRGQVMDAVSTQPIQNAVITGSGGSVLTDKDGRFQIKSPGNISISCTGYRNCDTTVVKDLKLYLHPIVSDLNQVIITGNRTRQKRNEAPVSISVINRKMIEETNAARADELLNKVSGVNMVSLGNEQHQMSIRQPVTTRSLFLYLEDGIPLRTTGLYNHNAMLEINLPSARQIEVIKGPASAYYGAEAIGGVINVLTQAPPKNLLINSSVQASDRGYGRIELQAGNSWNKTGFIITAYHAFRDQRSVFNNDFNKSAITIRADHSFNASTKLQSDVSIIHYYSDMPGSIDSARFHQENFESQYRFTYRKVPLFRMKSQLIHEWKNGGSSQAGLVFRNNRIEQNPNYRIRSVPGQLSAHGEINSSSFRTIMAFVQHQQTFQFLKARINAGLSVDNSPSWFNSRYISVSKNTNGIFENYQDSDSLLSDYNTRVLNVAAYSGLELSPLKGLKINIALRYDHFNFDFVNNLDASSYSGSSNTSRSFGRVTPKTGLTYNYRNVGGYINVSEGFVPPQISELFTGTKVPSLQPQEFHNYEAGVWFSKGDRFYTELAYYVLKGTNEIITIRNPDGSSEVANAGSTSHSGFEFSASYRPAKTVQFKVNVATANHTYKLHEEKGKRLDGKEMPGAPGFFGSSEIIIRPAKLKGFRIILENQFVSSYFMDSQNMYEYEGFDIMNVRLGYQHRRLNLWLNAKNVFNRHYATIAIRSGSSVYTPGDLREIVLGVGYKFFK